MLNVHALVATGVNADGHRKILGLQATSAEDGAGWLAIFRDLTARASPAFSWSPPPSTQGSVDGSRPEQCLADYDAEGWRRGRCGERDRWEAAMTAPATAYRAAVTAQPVA